MTDLGWMLAPIVACLLAMAALGWFGLHVLERGVIFVDLALAQVAALGATSAVFLGFDPDAPAGMALALLFTAVGSLAFASLRQFEDRVPQEALIGIAYAVSAALGMLLVELANDPHGAEKIQHLMVGNIVWVTWSEIALAAGALAAVGVVHAVFGRRFLTISFSPEQAAAEGRLLPVWDLVFYLSFGVVLTAIVNIVGVLLVFSFLVIPAVVARLFLDSIPQRLAAAYVIGFGASIAGVAVSYEHSTGPIVVSILGAVLAVSLAGLSVKRAARPLVRVAQLAGTASVGGAVVLLFVHLAGDNDHVESHAAHAIHQPTGPHDAHQDHDAHSPDASTVATPPPAEADPLTRLEHAVSLARVGDAEGLTILAGLTGDSAPFIRMEAHDRLVVVAGTTAPAYDPMAGPDTAGVWATWAVAPPDGWQLRAEGLPAE
jgi:zinc/manganese transport system permease protein